MSCRKKALVKVSIAVVRVVFDRPAGLLKRLEDGLFEGGGIVSRKISAAGEESKFDRQYRRDDLFLDSGTRWLLIDESVGFFEKADLYRKMDLPHRRGLLIYGPPGTGKTLFAGSCNNAGRLVFVWITAGDIQGAAAFGQSSVWRGPVSELCSSLKILICMRCTDAMMTSRCRWANSSSSLTECTRTAGCWSSRPLTILKQLNLR